MPDANIPSTDPLDLDALLMLQRERWEKGTPWTLEEILQQHPTLKNNKDPLLDLINHEIVLRTEFGSPPVKEDYLQLFPELKTDLNLLFEVEAALEKGSKESLGSSITAPFNSSKKGFSSIPEIPHYRIENILGEGGMGIVYKAEDQRLKRIVALKMIRGRGASTDDRTRFQAEAEAVAKLDHPNIVHIFDVGSHQDQPYFALEYVDGGSLSGLLKGVPQSPIFAAQLVERLSHAVHYAHQRGIIHRDLKPGNILLSIVSKEAAGAVERENRCFIPKKGTLL